MLRENFLCAWVLLLWLSACAAPPSQAFTGIQPTRYLEFSDLGEAQKAANFALWLPTFIPADLEFYKAWVWDYADGSETARITFAEPGDPLDANHKMLDLQMTITDQVISREMITHQARTIALDVRGVPVRGQTGFTYWTQSAGAGNSAILIWREGAFNIQLSLLGAWPQPDEHNPRSRDDLLLKIADSLQSALPTLIVSPQVEAPVSPTATPDCQSASGVTVKVERLSDRSAVLHASGLQPEEIPFVFYSTSVSGVGSRRGEAWGFAKGADAHGEFSYDLDDLQSLEGQSKATWDIRLVHQRGVACAEITLP